MHTPPLAPIPTLRAWQTRRLALVVAIGGAVGASARWGIGELLPYRPGTVGWATFVVNIVGSVLVGVCARRLEPGTLVWAAVVTGGLGGFTTVSAFVRELDDLFAADRVALGVTYAAVTVAAGWLAVHLAARPAASGRESAEPTTNGGPRADPATGVTPRRWRRR